MRKNLHFEQKCDGHIVRVSVTGPLFRWNVKLFCKAFQDELAKNHNKNITRIWLDLEKVTLLDDYTILRLQALLCEMNNSSLELIGQNVLFELIAGSAQNHQRILKHVGLSVRCHTDRMNALNSNL